MAGTLKTYFDFAENDYNYLQASIRSGIIANHMGAMAQEICEKYMKHIIDKYCNEPLDKTVPENVFNAEKKDVLRAHNLNKLLNFIKDNSKFQYPDETENAMMQINGYYFSTRYPGEDSFTLKEQDVKRAYVAASLCKRDTEEIEKNFEQSFMKINQYNEDTEIEDDYESPEL